MNPETWSPFRAGLALVAIVAANVIALGAIIYGAVWLVGSAWSASTG